MAIYKDLPTDLRSNQTRIITDREAVKQAIYNILHTRKGEMPGKPDYGCPVDNYVFEQIDPTLQTLLYGDIKSALTELEPRISVQDIAIEFQEAYNRIDIEVKFSYSGVKTEDYDTIKFSV